MLYLDNAATSRKKPLGVYASLLYNTIANSANAGRGGHKYSLRAMRKIYDTAELFAELFHVPNPERIAFTQNATAALNMAIHGVADAQSHIIVTQMEHNSVLRPVHSLCSYTIVPADSFGRVDIGQLQNAVKPNTKMIISTHVSNVCGTIQPIEEIAKIAHKNNLVFLLDAAQSAGSIEIDTEKAGIDMMAFSAHKGLLSPLGVGGLYVNEKIHLKPFITGGTGSKSNILTQPDEMPDMLQSGTLNAPAIIACRPALKYILRRTPAEIGRHERQLAEFFISESLNMKGVTVYGITGSEGRNGTVAFNLDGHDSIETAAILNEEFGIAVRGGWHCAYPSHQALGTEKIGAVRASFGAFNNGMQAYKLVDALYNIQKGRY